MTWLAPVAFVLLVLAPVLWLLAIRQETSGTRVVPHLPLVLGVLRAADAIPRVRPWRAACLVAALAACVAAAAEPRARIPVGRRVVTLAGPGAAVPAVEPPDVAVPLRVIAGGCWPVGPASSAATADHGPALAAAVAAAGADGLVRIAAPAPSPRRPVRAAASAVRGGSVVAYARWAGEAGMPVPTAALHGPSGAMAAAVHAVGADTEAEVAVASAPGAHVAALEIHGADPAPVAWAVLPPRRALVAAAGPVPPALLEALAAAPDLVAGADQVALVDVAAAAAERAPALILALGVAPDATVAADWLCVQPPGEVVTPPGTAAVALSFSHAHPIGRGLSPAGIALPDLRRWSGSSLAAVMQTDVGAGLLAGALPGGSRAVVLLGDPGPALADFPAFPRLIHRSLAWLAAARAAEACPVVAAPDPFPSASSPWPAPKPEPSRREGPAPAGPAPVLAIASLALLVLACGRVPRLSRDARP